MVAEKRKMLLKRIRVPFVVDDPSCVRMYLYSCMLIIEIVCVLCVCFIYSRYAILVHMFAVYFRVEDFGIWRLDRHAFASQNLIMNLYRDDLFSRCYELFQSFRWCIYLDIIY